MSRPVVRPAGFGDLDPAMELAGELDGLQGPWRVFEPKPGAEQDRRATYRRALEDPDSCCWWQLTAPLEGILA